MQIEQGRQAVWQHAQEAGLADDIKLIASFFDIKDVCIITPGKMTFIEDRPRKMHRVPAIPTKIDWKAVVQTTKDNARKYK